MYKPVGSAAHPGHWNDSWTDVTVLCALQLVNGLVGWHEEQKAGDAVAALKKSLPPPLPPPLLPRESGSVRVVKT